MREREYYILEEERKEGQMLEEELEEMRLMTHEDVKKMCE